MAFALTIASFVMAAILSEYRARGIEAAAQSIATVAVPAIDHLARARTELRHTEVLLDDFVDADGVAGAPKLQQSWKTFEREYAVYLTLSPYLGEPALWGRIATSMSEMNASIDCVLRKVQDGDTRGAVAEMQSRTKPAVDRVDEGLLEAVEMNGRNAAELSNRIKSIKSASRSWSIFLDALSILLAAIAAFLVTRVISRLMALMETRASELEQFADRVAHDLRSPLQSVGIALELTRQRNPELDAKTHSILDRGTRTLQRVGQLVDGLLLFARAGKSPSEGAHANVKEVVVEVIEGMRTPAEEKGIELQVEEPPAWVVACSPGVLVSLVSNLVGNAIKYMGSSTIKRIDVRVRGVEHMVRIEVRDTGPGVPPGLRDSIFDPYVRAAESTIPGIGLGLATVRRLGEAHGGAVGVEANVDSGSLFWFQLPRVAAEEANDSHASVVREAPPASVHHPSSGV